MASIFGRQVILVLTNKSGGSVIAGDVVIVDTSNDAAFTTTTSAGYTGGVGVAQETIANNATGRVLFAGYASLVNVNASVTRGQYGTTHTVAKQATGTASRTAGTFAQWLTGGTTPTARIFSPDLAAAAGNVAVDAIWDAAGDLAVGTGADTAAKLAITVPAANILNVLGVVNGETTWSVKSIHDATAPVTQAFGDTAAAGTALTAAHRDHKHGMPAAGGATISRSAYGSPPSSPAAGDLWYPSDGYGELVYTGSAWAPLINGIEGVLPSNTGFSWINQGSSTIDTSGAAHVLTTVAGDNSGYRYRVKTAPSAPYTITAFLKWVGGGNQFPGLSLVHRESSSSKLTSIDLFMDTTSSTLRRSYWTDNTTFNSSADSFNGAGMMAAAGIWLRIADDNTNRTYWWSADGRNWFKLSSQGRTTNMTANQVGWGARPHASYGSIVTLLSWQEA